jgi:hypothetical protein
MTDQTPPQEPTRKRSPIEPGGRLRAVVPGRPVRSREFSQAEARQIAERLYRDSRSNLRTYVVELLHNFLALTEARLFQLCVSKFAISDNADSFATTLNRYQRDGIIMRMPYPIMQHAHAAGLRPPDGRRLIAYALGPVGEELAEMVVGDDIPPLRQARGDVRWVHDLLCAEAMWRITEKYRAGGWQAEPAGPQRAAIWYVNERDPNARGRFVLKPDGLLRVVEPGKTPLVLLVEFQNNSFAKDAKPKVRGYRQFFANADYTEHWRAQWRTESVPSAIIIYHKPPALKSFQAAVSSLFLPNAPSVPNYFALALDMALGPEHLQFQQLR